MLKLKLKSSSSGAKLLSLHYQGQFPNSVLINLIVNEMVIYQLYSKIVEVTKSMVVVLQQFPYQTEESKRCKDP